MVVPNRRSTFAFGAPRGSRFVIGHVRSTLSEDATVLVWDLDPDHWETIACRMAGRDITRAEWNRYLPHRDYEPVCG